MIALNRIRTANAVPADFYGDKRIANNLALIKSKLAGDFDAGKATSDVWKSSVWDKAKDQLLLETGGKCAYCESPTSVVAYGDVEHFRPKSKYWWLAYCYENYLPACTICNQRFKRDEFLLGAKGKPLPEPAVKKGMTAAQQKAAAKAMTVDALKDADGMPMKSFTDALKAEMALLIHPYFQDPSEYLAYRPIPETKEVLVIPTKPAAKPVVEACEKLFGINRQELRDERYRHYATYMTFRYVLETGAVNDKLKKSVQKRVAEMAAGKLRYTGMIRWCEAQKLDDLPWDFEV